MPFLLLDDSSFLEVPLECGIVKVAHEERVPKRIILRQEHLIDMLLGGERLLLLLDKADLSHSYLCNDLNKYIIITKIISGIFGQYSLPWFNWMFRCRLSS